jgi:TRAP-type C4-dicarboxylate transport system permease small subunit
MDDRLSQMERYALVLAAGCCAMLAGLSLAEVVFRVLRIKFYFGSEVSGFLTGWLIFFALPCVTREQRHIRVTFLVDLLPPRAGAATRILGELVMLGYQTALIALCWTITADSWQNHLRAEGILRIPTFYPFAGIMIGFGLLWLSQAGLVLRLVRGAVTATHPSRDTVS